jgi:hypothetical protein
MSRPCIPDRFLWGILVGLGLAIPALILVARLGLMCPTMELRPFALLPLSGIVNGRDPHLFSRVMHDLTHPVLLLCYGLGLTYVTVRCVGRPLNARSSQVLVFGLLLIHLTFLVSYFISLSLPIGDMISTL